MKIKIIFLYCLSFILPVVLQAQSIRNTPHDLSITRTLGKGNANYSDMCSFCHISHIDNPRNPQWDKLNSGRSYIPYKSSTIQANPGQPTGASLLCLTCHDGTIALQTSTAKTNYVSFGLKSVSQIKRRSNLGQDLSDDHPISFTYDASLAAVNQELTDPSFLSDVVFLDDKNQMQCTSCHDPHKNINSHFLVASTRYSGLCLHCHQKNYWSNSSHRLSNATWNGTGFNPWFHTSFSTVSENACENCHNPHGAEGHSRLMNYEIEEANCLVCHNGNVADKNIENQLSKPYVHNVYRYNKIHDPNESAFVQTPHVECADCHDPHASNSNEATPPGASGLIEGVKGIDSNGNSVNIIQFEYELCYRCHSDSHDKPGSIYTRQIEQTNVRLEFDVNNPSYHPIEGPGKNSNVPSLISPLSSASQIYCSDCHASDGTNSPKGPHGSIYPHILKYRYETEDKTKESYQNYRLCYECHSRDEIIEPNSEAARKVHTVHIMENDVSCNTCHDPHGISYTQGTTTNNTHLINFNVSIVSALPESGRLEFEDLGDYQGRCYLSCHGVSHNPKSY